MSEQLDKAPKRAQNAAKDPQRRARVGIVIRTKDRPSFVVRAVSTVCEQDYEQWHIALINDGGDPEELTRALKHSGFSDLFDAGKHGASKDGATNDGAVKHGAGRATRVDNPRSVGRSEAFNIGARLLDTEFVCCLDDDDTWDPTFLSQLVGFFDATHAMAPDLGGVAALVTAIREDIVTDKGQTKLVQLGEDGLPQAFKRTDFFLNPIAYATYRHDLYPVQWMLKREQVLAVGGFPVDFNVMEDRAFMNAFLQRWRLAILDDHLAFHHRRISRTGDTKRTVVMNTLDNPSYDWRLYSDLAKGAVNTPPKDWAGQSPTPRDDTGDLIRAAATTIVKELNDETSALWHKMNGEAMALRAQIEALEARIGDVAPPEPRDTDPAKTVWSLWETIGERDIGYPLAAGKPFLDRMILSMAENQAGLLTHAVVAQHRMVVQVPRTQEFAALEIDLSGLPDPHRDLNIEMIVSGDTSFAFETALCLSSRDRLGRRTHRFEDTHVHSCPSGGWTRVRRGFGPDWFSNPGEARFSIILPRHAQNFQLTLRDLIISRD